MSTLTHEDLQVLRAHFPASDHEFDYNKNAYIKEQSICNRIEEVDPAWSLSEPKILWRDGEAGTRICEVTVSMTIKGVSRGGVGQKEIVLTKNGNGEANQAAKSAATDALKRAARLFGIGRYLLETPNWVNNEATMAKWLNQPTETAPSNVTEMPSKNGKQEAVEKVTDEILKVGVKKDKSKQWLILNGLTFFSRDPFRALEYDDDVIEQLGKVGLQDLPDPVQIVYSEDSDGNKTPLRMQRKSTGEVIILDGSKVKEVS